MEHNVNERVEHLLNLLSNSDANEIEVQTPRWRIHARRVVTPAPIMASEQSPIAQAEKPAQPRSVMVRSPLVGFFHTRRKPVKLGDHVERGEVICTIEAMGLMNEVQTPVSGQVVEVLAEDGFAVEYGQPLYRIVEDSDGT